MQPKQPQVGLPLRRVAKHVGKQPWRMLAGDLPSRQPEWCFCWIDRGVERFQIPVAINIGRFTFQGPFGSPDKLEDKLERRSVSRRGGGIV
jgi:hypothetical protein